MSNQGLLGSMATFFLSLCLARDGNGTRQGIALHYRDEKIYPRESPRTFVGNISSPSPFIRGDKSSTGIHPRLNYS
jgi:hypothetical protein